MAHMALYKRCTGRLSHVRWFQPVEATFDAKGLFVHHWQLWELELATLYHRVITGN